jgi:hypothetical protein
VNVFPLKIKNSLFSIAPLPPSLVRYERCQVPSRFTLDEQENKTREMKKN